MTEEEFQKENVLCREGEPQTYLVETKPKTPGPFRFKNYRKEVQVLIQNNGVTLEMDVCECEGKGPGLYGDCLEGEFLLYKIYLHWPSNHSLNGEKYPLCVKLVHYKRKYKSISRAIKNNAIAILEVFVDTRNHVHSNVFGAIARQVELVKDEFMKPVMLERKIRLSDFIPTDVENYFKYKGSLNSPKCKEGVTWVVFLKPIHICSLQLKMIMNIQDKEGNPIKCNSDCS